MKILITGVAGFIGFHLAKRLLESGNEITGVDSLTRYYDINLKKDRLHQLEGISGYTFKKLDISDRNAVQTLFRDQTETKNVIHLAAQAGVRYSIENPYAYVDSNIQGFINILEGCRHNDVEHLIFASSSSVYGANTRLPFSVHDNVDHPLSLYAATKKSNELMAHAYSNLYDLPITGLRFFTVYGPWGRPDMALFKFTKQILKGQPIDIYNNGHHRRDFTYIDDIIDNVVAVIDKIPVPDKNWQGEVPDPGTSFAPYRIYNIGNNNPVELLRFIEIIESCLGEKAVRNYLPIQPGDVPETYADIDDLIELTGLKPKINIEEGITRFIDWYLDYYKHS